MTRVPELSRSCRRFKRLVGSTTGEGSLESRGGKHETGRAQAVSKWKAHISGQVRAVLLLDSQDLPPIPSAAAACMAVRQQNAKR